jgi:hypothetical protein
MLEECVLLLDRHRDLEVPHPEHQPADAVQFTANSLPAEKIDELDTPGGGIRGEVVLFPRGQGHVREERQGSQVGLGLDHPVHVGLELVPRPALVLRAVIDHVPEARGPPDGLSPVQDCLDVPASVRAAEG